jgi:adenylate cyclase
LFLERNGWSEELARHRSKAIDLARRALQVDDSDPDILASSALVFSNYGEDIGAMISMIDRALAINPNFARGWNLSGVLRTQAGEHDLAIEHIETCLRLNPRGRVGIGTPLLTIGAAYFFKH